MVPQSTCRAPRGRPPGPGRRSGLASRPAAAAWLGAGAGRPAHSASPATRRCRACRECQPYWCATLPASSRHRHAGCQKDWDASGTLQVRDQAHLPRPATQGMGGTASQYCKSQQALYPPEKKSSARFKREDIGAPGSFEKLLEGGCRRNGLAQTPCLPPAKGNECKATHPAPVMILRQFCFFMLIACTRP